MRSSALAILVCAVSLCGCTSSDQEDLSKYATDVQTEVERFLVGHVSNSPGEQAGEWGA